MENDGLKVSEIKVYPVKSCAGWSLDRADVTATGFERDREWMIVDEQGAFITQRQYPMMAVIKPSLAAGVLTLRAPDVPPVEAPVLIEGRLLPVEIWASSCIAVDQGDAAAEWLGAFLGKSCRLVRMAPDSTRKIKEKYQKARR